jgi:putative peptidoglycan lipid II flippase
MLAPNVVTPSPTPSRTVPVAWTWTAQRRSRIPLAGVPHMTDGRPVDTIEQQAVAATSSSTRNSALVAAGIMLSRVAGLVRTAVTAHFLGVQATADALQAAMRIPNLLQNLLGEGVLSASFIPVYSRLLAEGREEEAGRVAGAIAGLLTVLTGVLALVGVLLAEPVTRIVAWGFTGSTLELTTTLTRILFPGVGFLVLSAWCLGVLNSHRKFFLSYVAPVIWNVAQIAVLVVVGTWVLSDELADPTLRQGALSRLTVALAWGVLVGGFLQFAIQLPSVLRSSGAPRLSLNVRLEGVRTALRSFWPVVAGRGVVQLMIYVDIALASLLAEGALSALEYATRLALLPISVFGMSAAASELPELSSLDVDDRGRMSRRMSPMLSRIAFYVVPSMAGFVVLGDLLFDLVLLPLPSRLAWLVLLGSTVGLLSNTSSRLLQSALYASGDTRTPARFAILRVVLAAVLGVVLMLQFDQLQLTHTGIALDGALPAFTPLPAGLRATDQTSALRLGAVGLALAAGMSSWLEFALLRRYLARRGLAARAGGGLLVRTTLAGLLGAGLGVVVRTQVDGLPLLVQILAIGVSIVAAYLACAHLVGLPEVAQLRRLLPGRRRP